MRNPVRHRILHQRQQQKRRHEAFVGLVGDDDLVTQPISVVYTLHGEEPRDEPELARERDAALPTQREAFPKEVREQHAHASRRCRIRRR